MSQSQCHFETRFQGRQFKCRDLVCQQKNIHSQPPDPICTKGIYCPFPKCKKLHDRVLWIIELRKRDHLAKHGAPLCPYEAITDYRVCTSLECWESKSYSHRGSPKEICTNGVNGSECEDRDCVVTKKLHNQVIQDADVQLWFQDIPKFVRCIFLGRAIKTFATQFLFQTLIIYGELRFEAWG